VQGASSFPFGKGREEGREGGREGGNRKHTLTHLLGHLEAVHVLSSTARDEVAHPLSLRRVEQVLEVVVVPAQVGVHLPGEGGREGGREGGWESE
jgi:hypothetical protein